MRGHYRGRNEEEALNEMKNKIKESGNSDIDVTNESEAEANAAAFAAAFAAVFASQRVKFEEE